MRVTLLWIVGASAATLAVNAHYADAAYDAAAARSRALALDVDSNERSVVASADVGIASRPAIGPDTQYLFDRGAERQRYALAHPSNAWGWTVLLTLFTAMSLPFVLVMDWFGRRLCR